MDNSFLIVESFDETVYPEKNAESQEIDDYENSLEALKAHMDRVLPMDPSFQFSADLLIR